MAIRLARYGYQLLHSSLKEDADVTILVEEASFFAERVGRGHSKRKVSNPIMSCAHLVLNSYLPTYTV